MILIMMGAQGTGKGTVAKVLSQKKGLPHISTGEMLREIAAKGTELGNEVKRLIDNGIFISDEMMATILENRLNEEDAKNGAILDGFPRNLEQAKILDKMLKNKNEKVNLVVNLTTPREELIARIEGRRICSNPDCKADYNLMLHPPKEEGICDKCHSALKQREDDASREAIERRLATYDEKTKPVVDFYEQRGIVTTQEITKDLHRFATEAVEDILRVMETIEEK